MALPPGPYFCFTLDILLPLDIVVTRLSQSRVATEYKMQLVIVSITQLFLSGDYGQEASTWECRTWATQELAKSFAAAVSNDPKVGGGHGRSKHQRSAYTPPPKKKKVNKQRRESTFPRCQMADVS